MARGPLFLTAMWSVGTAAATAVSWVGAHAVSSAIRATPVPAVPPDRQALASRPPGARAGLAGTTIPTTAGSVATAGTGAAPPARTTTLSDPGGTITARCSGAQIQLVSASPTNGYRGDVQSAGPSEITVTFLSRDGYYRLVSRCGPHGPVGSSTFTPTGQRR